MRLDDLIPGYTNFGKMSLVDITKIVASYGICREAQMRLANEPLRIDPRALKMVKAKVEKKKNEKSASGKHTYAESRRSVREEFLFAYPPFREEFRTLLLLMDNLKSSGGLLNSKVRDARLEFENRWSLSLVFGRGADEEEITLKGSRGIDLSYDVKEISFFDIHNGEITVEEGTSPALLSPYVRYLVIPQNASLDEAQKKLVEFLGNKEQRKNKTYTRSDAKNIQKHTQLIELVFKKTPVKQMVEKLFPNISNPDAKESKRTQIYQMMDMVLRVLKLPDDLLESSPLVRQKRKN